MFEARYCCGAADTSLLYPTTMTATYAVNRGRGGNDLARDALQDCLTEGERKRERSARELLRGMKARYSVGLFRRNI